jgi:competence protein ComEC
MSAIALFCCAYILGLLCSQVPWICLSLSSLSIGFSFLYKWRRFPQKWRQVLPTSRQLLATALIGLLATAYIWVRLPQPGFSDVSSLVSAASANLPVQVSGTIERRPALTRRGSVQLWLDVQQAIQNGGQPQRVTGRLYVTLPRQAAKALSPGQLVLLTGQLYKPSAATRPHGYDFKAFLGREGAFAGLRATQAQIQKPGSARGGWAVRARIVRSLVQGTNPRTGTLLSALVLGKDAADIDYDLKDDFIQAGLAHALAASGFQVSLILGAVLALARSLPPSRQALVGLLALLFYGLLSGAEPSIVRAILMGCASLAALSLKRQTRPVPLLLAVATLMLLYNPLWVWDLGFQLSVLATLGLMVSVPPLMTRLDWLPTTIGTLVAVPLAATIWTLPLQLHTFGILPLYSLIANVLSAPLLSGLTIGGLIASCGALLWPPFGSVLAWLLFWSTQLLIAIVSGISQLPGHALSLGSISLWQLLALYGCIGFAWWSAQQWKLMTAVGLLILVVPMWQVQSQRFLVTVFDETRVPMMAIEHPTSTVVLNSGNRWVASQSLVPFLQQEGINRIDWAIATDNASSTESGWTALLDRIPITTLSRGVVQSEVGRSQTQKHPQQQIDIVPETPLKLGALQAVLWRAEPAILELNLGAQRWLLVDNTNETDLLAWLTAVQLPPIQTLWWTGKPFSNRLLSQLHPQTLILSGKQVKLTDVLALKQQVPQVFWTARDGTIQWTPKGFSTTVNPGDNTLTPL